MCRTAAFVGCLKANAFLLVPRARIIGSIRAMTVSSLSIFSVLTQTLISHWGSAYFGTGTVFVTVVHFGLTAASAAGASAVTAPTLAADATAVAITRCLRLNMTPSSGGTH